MDIFFKIQETLEELLDVEPDDINLESYVIKDLGAESIDLLELAVALNSAFDIPVKDDEIFLRNLRLYLTEAQETGRDSAQYLSEKYEFLSSDRIAEILKDVSAGPVLKVKDLMAYIKWQVKGV